MRIKATLPRRVRLALRRDRVAKFDRNPAKQIVRLGALRIGAYRVAVIALTSVPVPVFAGFWPLAGVDRPACLTHAGTPSSASHSRHPPRWTGR